MCARGVCGGGGGGGWGDLWNTTAVLFHIIMLCSCYCCIIWDSIYSQPSINVEVLFDVVNVVFCRLVTAITRSKVEMLEKGIFFRKSYGQTHSEVYQVCARTEYNLCIIATNTRDVRNELLISIWRLQISS